MNPGQQAAPQTLLRKDARWLPFRNLAGIAILALPILFPPAFAEQTAPETTEVVAGNTAFALNLYGKLRTADGNLFFSPYSISSVLAMTYGGARGRTAEQMAQVLQFATVPADKLHIAFGALKAGIDSIGQHGAVQLYTANALWPQKGYPLLGDYLDLLKRQYGASASPLDYKNNKEAARRTINQWVEEQTRHKITDLIHPDALDSRTRLVLVDAIYFLGRWNSQFKKYATSEDTFHRTAGDEVKCQMMRNGGSFAYAETPDLQIVELPYAGNEVAMILLLPRTVDGIGSLEGNLTAAGLAGWIGSLKDQEVTVQLPKFSQTGDLSLGDTLKGLGMTLAFEQSADFSGIDGHANSLFISAVAHKAYVSVTEEGTEAAAATAVAVWAGAAMPRVPVPLFRADHPFLFLIMEKNTGSILFMGRVMEPKT